MEYWVLNSIGGIGDGFLYCIIVYKDTTSRLHGYGYSVLLLVKSPVWMHLMSSRLFS